MTRRRPPFTPEQIASIRAMRAAGAAWRAIGIMMNISALLLAIPN